MKEKLGRFSVSRETIDRLVIYEKLVRKWNPSINLVSRNSLEHLWDRHIQDSAQLLEYASAGEQWLDIGSGGGFPGMVIAIVSAELAPVRHLTLIESDKRKAVFLNTVARETGIACTVLSARVEETEPQMADVLTARALGPLNLLLAYAERHLKTGGIALFPKGETWAKEESDARAEWLFSCESFTSITEPKAAILKIKDISRV